MKKAIVLGFALAMFVSAPMRAQTAGDAAAPAQVDAAQAPDAATRKISELVHAGKYAEAQRLTDGLLVAYPNDQRLIKAQALIQSLIATPANPALAAQPATSADQLTGMDRVNYNSLIELARQAQQSADLNEQKSSLKQFMEQSSTFLQKHPEQMLIWQLRAASALSSDDPYAEYAGYEAGEKLLAAGAADSSDPNLQQLISKLQLKGWLDTAKMTEAKKNTAVSRINGLGMTFVPVPGTAVLFSVFDTNIHDFQAFVNDTHYEATQGMLTGVTGHQGATFLASYVQEHYENRGDTWEHPGWALTPTTPVAGISWVDAKAFCQWLTEKERHAGKIRTEQSYRLPTDAEWSIAVGLDAEKGDTPASKSGKDKKIISPLGQDAPNVYGIYEMGGSVYQFCEDWSDEKKTLRVLRGGSWFHSYRLASARGRAYPAVRTNEYGFRVVLADNVQDQ